MASMHNSIIHNVYNYYHQAFAPHSSNKKGKDDKSVSRSESKGIYSQIRSLDKESPVFLMNYNKDVRAYSVHMKESALKFRSEIASLGGLDQEDMFGKKSIFSSDDSIADARYYKDGGNEELDAPLELVVKNLAHPQKNQGTFLPSDDVGVPPGAYSFDVANTVSNYELQFSVSETDTNLNIQQRLARLINNSGIGLSAHVEEDGLGNSALSLTSNTTGYNDGSNPFTISDEDTSQRSGIVDFLGIREVTEPARWATYEINGVEKQSPTNDVIEDQKYAITLKKAAPDTTVTMETKPDYESLTENIRGLASSYNNFVRAVSEYLVKQPRTTLLVSSMKQMTGSYSAQMANFGMHQNSEGMLEVDNDKLREGLSSESAGETLQSLKDFTKTALTKASQVQLNPMNYVDKKIVAYKNPNKEHFSNPYLTSAYSGLMFNSYM